MKILIIGATGNSGLALLKSSVAAGHQVATLVRNESKLRELVPADLLESVELRIGDALDHRTLVEACKDRDVVINAAGNVNDGETFITLSATVMQAVEEGLGDDGRYWFFGGAAALGVPGTAQMTVDLPRLPAVYRAHQVNFERAKKTSLNWSMLCPGPMTPADDGKSHAGLRIARNSWPVSKPSLVNFLPKIATSIAFLRKIPELTISYEDAAEVILTNLAADSSLARSRVGVALPVGMKRRKAS